MLRNPNCLKHVIHLDLDEAGEVHGAMLAQSNKLQDRFAVLDIVDGDKEITQSVDPVSDFRNNVGMNYLKYGAAYYPWIKTTLPFKIDYEDVYKRQTGTVQGKNPSSLFSR